MLHLPYHLGLLIAGLGVVWLRLEVGGLADLSVWWSPLALVLVLPARRLEVRHELLSSRGPRLLALTLARATPLLVLAMGLFLTRLPELTSLDPAWLDLAWAVPLLPLLFAHLGLAWARSRPGSARPLPLSWALFAWSVLVLYLALSSLVAASPRILALVEQTSLGGFLHTLLLLGVMVSAVPRLLLFWIDTAPPPAGARRLAEEAAFARTPFQLMEWRTGDELSNAMVLAMPFAPRPILFSDRFLGNLTRGEFLAVLAHELGHVRGRHVSTMAAWVLGGVLGFDLAARSWLPMEVQDGPLGVALALGFLGLMFLGVGWLSRRLELEADLFALEATGEWRSLVQVLVEFGSLRRRRATWRHFAPAERALFLRAAARDVGVGQRLRARLARWRTAGLALAGLGLVLTLALGLGELRSERVRVDLAAGDLRAASARYEVLDADERAAVTLGALEPAYFEELLALGSVLQQDGPLTLADLGAGALAADSIAGVGGVVAHLDLALFLDPSPGLWALRDALGRPGAASAGDAELPAPWGEVRAGRVTGGSPVPVGPTQDL